MTVAKALIDFGKKTAKENPVSTGIFGTLGGAPLLAAPIEPEGTANYYESALYSIPEFFGVAEAPLHIEEWRSRNPTAGFASQVLGTGGIGGAYVKAAEKSAKLGGIMQKSIDKFTVREKGRFVEGATREIGRFAPLEAVRFGTDFGAGATYLGEGIGESFTNALATSAFNVAVGAGVAGTLNQLLSPGTTAATSQQFADFVRQTDLDIEGLSATQQLNKLDEYIRAQESFKTNKSGNLDLAKRMRAHVKTKVRLEDPIDGSYLAGKVLKKLTMGDASVGLKSYKFVASGPNGEGIVQNVPRAKDDIDYIRREFGFGEEFEKYVQFPRVLVTTKASGENLLDALKQNDGVTFRTLNGTEWKVFNQVITTKKGAEREVQIAVATKKIDDKDVSVSAMVHDWRAFEADAKIANEVFGGKKTQDLYANTRVDPVMFEFQEKADLFQTYNREAENFSGEFRSKSLDDQMKQKAEEELRIELKAQNKDFDQIKRLNPEEFKRLYRRKMQSLELNVSSPGYKNFSKAFAEQTASSDFAYGNSPLARKVFNGAKATISKGQNKAMDMVYGRVVGDVENYGFNARDVGRLAKDFFKAGVKTEGGVKNAIDDLTDQQWADLETSLRSLEEPDVNSTIRKAYDKIIETVQQSYDDLNIHQRAVDANFVSYGLNRKQILDVATREGRARMVIRNKDGQVVGVLSGKKKDALFDTFGKIRAINKDFVADAAEDGIDPLRDHELARMVLHEIPEARQFRAAYRQVLANKQTGNPRGDVRDGFENRKALVSKGEFLKELHRHISAHQGEAAKLAFSYAGNKDLMELAFKNPEKYLDVTRRLGRMVGEKGYFSDAFETFFDRLPLIGGAPGDTARRLQRLNQFIYTSQLGFFNLSHAGLTMATAMQTVAPELYFVTKAPSKELMKHYSVMPLVNADGVVRGSGYVLSPYRMMTEAVGEVANPSDGFKKLVREMEQERFLDPKIAEEFLGAQSDLGKNINQQFKDGNWFDAIMEVGSHLPRKAEKFSRMHAAATAYKFGKANGLDGDKLKRFTYEFVDRTMFKYGAGDRPNLLTGTVGSTWGLYKTFMFNYIQMMAQYAKNGPATSFAPVMSMMGGTMLLGGVGALGPTYLATEILSKMLNDKSAMESYYELAGPLVGETVSDFGYFGVPGLFGFSLQSQVQTPGRDPMDELGFLISTAHIDQLQYLGKALGTASDTIAAGEMPYENDLFVKQVVRALTPKAAWRMAQVSEDNSLNSLNTGYPLLTDFSEGGLQGFFMDELPYALGLNQVDAAKAYEISGTMWKQKEKRSALLGIFGRRYAEAKMAGDVEEMNRAYKMGIAAGLPGETILRSAARRERLMTQSVYQRGFNLEQVGELQNTFLLQE